MAEFDDFVRKGIREFKKYAKEESEKETQEIFSASKVDFDPKKMLEKASNAITQSNEGKQAHQPITKEPNHNSSIPCKKNKSARSASESLIHKGIVLEYVYDVLGLVLGLASIIGGVVLGLNGVAGSTSWTTKFFSLESQINDAAPGVILFIVGLFMIIVTKPKVRLKDLKG